ncbi:hypothetical protein BGW80DRAFT_1251189 [Lactifluus volemus]|nr:hypothetical protein BGW80DRAFT_1251189 [Lactifluus volemus]
MRLFKHLSLLGLFFGARASSLKTREPAAHPLDARELLDVCALVKTSDVDFPDQVAILSFMGIICLCKSSLPAFIQTNPYAIVAVAEAQGGASTVTSVLSDIIDLYAAISNCPYPDHSIPVCVDRNACAFKCMDGFTASPPDNPTTCVCDASSVVCNGQCVEPGSCPTSAPSTKKKRWIGSGTCAEMGPEWAACGVFGGGARSWECINTARDLESCGGCMLPLTPYVPIGQDCSSLPGVADVACIGGECVVHRCLPGYVPTRDGSHCISRHRKILPHSEYDEDEAESVPARVYGPGHVPLGKHKK